jgi:hypothetical protein
MQQSAQLELVKSWSRDTVFAPANYRKEVTAIEVALTPRRVIIDRNADVLLGRAINTPVTAHSFNRGVVSLKCGTPAYAVECIHRQFEHISI